EDGIRDKLVTGVQTCALPICRRGRARRQDARPRDAPPGGARAPDPLAGAQARRLAAPLRRGAPRARGGGEATLIDSGPNEERDQIGRASCRERGEIAEGSE